MITTSKKQAHQAVKGGSDCILVELSSTESCPIIGGHCAVFWFANYTSRNGKIGYTSQAKATQIFVG